MVTKGPLASLQTLTILKVFPDALDSGNSCSKAHARASRHGKPFPLAKSTRPLDYYNVLCHFRVGLLCTGTDDRAERLYRVSDTFGLADTHMAPRKSHYVEYCGHSVQWSCTILSCVWLLGTR